jgi:hypothetical protein
MTCMLYMPVCIYSERGTNLCHVLDAKVIDQRVECSGRQLEGVELLLDDALEAAQLITRSEAVVGRPADARIDPSCLWVSSGPASSQQTVRGPPQRSRGRERATHCCLVSRVPRNESRTSRAALTSELTSLASPLELPAPPLLELLLRVFSTAESPVDCKPMTTHLPARSAMRACRSKGLWSCVGGGLCDVM